MKRSYTMRFYTAHDFDLVSLILEGYSMPDLLHQSLTFFVEKRACVFHLSKHTYPCSTKKVRVMEKKLILDERKDQKIIDLLENMHPGTRNHFFKTILRLYLCDPFPFPYIEEDRKERMGFLEPFYQGKEKIFVYPKKRKEKKKESDSKKEVLLSSTESEVTSSTDNHMKKPQERIEDTLGTRNTKNSGQDIPISETIPDTDDLDSLFLSLLP